MKRKAEYTPPCYNALICNLLSVHESCVTPVMKMGDPCEVWNQRKENFKMVSQPSTEGLLELHQNIRMDAYVIVLDYVNR